MKTKLEAVLAFICAVEGGVIVLLLSKLWS